MKKNLETDRLILRPWRETDAECLYEYAKNPMVGPIAGWPVHTSVENSKDIIHEVLSVDGTYAVAMRGEDRAIGSIGLMIGKESHLNLAADEGEIGYWIGEPYWGQGLIPEAVRELTRYAFEELGITTLWCGHFDGNEKSKRAQEKCGFRFHHTEKDKEWTLTNEVKTLHVTCMTKAEWEARP